MHRFVGGLLGPKQCKSHLGSCQGISNTLAFIFKYRLGSRYSNQRVHTRWGEIKPQKVTLSLKQLQTENELTNTHFQPPCAVSAPPLRFTS
jgi:hypothetical protein